jgi:hypothetical protein
VQALGHLGYSVDDAIFLVRYHRSKWALNNDLFVDYLTTGLDVTALLTDLTAADLGPGNDDSAFAVQGDEAFGIFTGQADGVDVLRLWLFRAKVPRIQR